MNDKTDVQKITKEIEWLEFDIQMDECLEGSKDFHLVKARLDENRKTLTDLKALING